MRKQHAAPWHRRRRKLLKPKMPGPQPRGKDRRNSLRNAEEEEEASDEEDEVPCMPCESMDVFAMRLLRRAAKSRETEAWSAKQVGLAAGRCLKAPVCRQALQA